jgi:hypothetical protein
MAQGRQLKVYLHPEDRPAVDEYVRGELAGALLTERSRDSHGFEVADSAGGGTGRLICPGSLVAGLRPRHIAARDEWILDPATDPLIEWWFAKLDEGVLFPGRFYYLPSGQPPEFLETAKGLFAWVRAHTEQVETEWGTERLGPRAAGLLRAGLISLRRNPPGSRI